MPLGEAIILLNRLLYRKFGPGYKARFIDIRKQPDHGLMWQENGLPLVMINGENICIGDFSLKRIMREVARRIPNQ